MVHDEAFALLDNLSRLDPVQSTVLAAAIKCEIAADHRNDNDLRSRHQVGKRQRK